MKNCLDFMVEKGDKSDFELAQAAFGLKKRELCLGGLSWDNMTAGKPLPKAIRNKIYQFMRRHSLITKNRRVDKTAEDQFEVLFDVLSFHTAAHAFCLATFRMLCEQKVKNFVHAKGMLFEKHGLCRRDEQKVVHWVDDTKDWLLPDWSGDISIEDGRGGSRARQSAKDGTADGMKRSDTAKNPDVVENVNTEDTNANNVGNKKGGGNIDTAVFEPASLQMVPDSIICICTNGLYDPALCSNTECQQTTHAAQSNGMYEVHSN